MSYLVKYSSIDSKYQKPIVVVFWIIIIFLLDPGGFVSKYVGGSSALYKFYHYLLVSVAFACYYIHKRHHHYLLKEHESIIQWIRYLLITWMVYYLAGYANLITNERLIGMDFFAKHYRMIVQVFLVIPVAYFTSIGTHPYFVRTQSKVTITVIVLLVLTVLSGVKFVEVNTAFRGYTQGVRFLLVGNGLVMFSLSLAVAMILSNFKYNKLVLFAGIAIVIYIFISITRRSILAIFMHLLIINFLFNYINGRNFLSFTKLLSIKIISFVLLILAFVLILFPGYFATTVDSFVNLYKILFTDYKPEGSELERISLTEQVGIVNAIKDNFYFGTGYHPDWFSGDGGQDRWEGSDYVFLGSFAQYGLIGLLIFVPYYIIAVNIIIKTLRTIKKHRIFIFANRHIFLYVVLLSVATSSEFIKNIIEYPNWFHPIAATGTTPAWYIYFGLLIGSYFSLQNELIIRNQKL